MDFRPLLAGRFSGETPVWDERRGCVFFVDMARYAVHAVRLDGSDHRHWPMPELPGSIGLCASGRLIVAQPRRLLLLDPDSGAITPFCDIAGEPDSNRLNDGKVGPDGAYWVGSMDMRPERDKIGSLYRVTGDGAVTRVLSNYVEVSNGLAWSPDGKYLYFSDSRGPWVERFAFDAETGALGPAAPFISLSEAQGRPDGAVCDALGNYWSAGVSAGRVNRISPAGVIEGVYPTPVAAPSMPQFCGPDLDQLVVTSLIPAEGATDRDGTVLIAPAGTRGLPTFRMAGV